MLVATGRNTQIMVEPLCRVRIVVRHILRDGTCTDPKEIAFESGAQVCMAPRTAALGQGTQPPSVDDLISMSNGGGVTLTTGVVPILSVASEITTVLPTWQTIRRVSLPFIYLNTDPAPDHFYVKLRNVFASIASAIDSPLDIRVTVSGITSPDKVYNFRIETGTTFGALAIGEQIDILMRSSVVVTATVEGASTTPKGLHVELSTYYDANYIPPEDI
jgi:hypothetical protein